MGKTKKTKNIVEKLSEIILYEMGKDELTNAEMAQKCGISKRKLEEIIYKEDKGLLLETFMNICDGINIRYGEVFK